MQRGLVYVRVSSDEQVKGMSLDFQKQDCLRYAQTKGITVEEIFEERGESAKFADRPELIKLLERCARKPRIDALIVWKVDRLSRRQLDYYYIKRKLIDLGIGLHSATEPSLEDSTSIQGKVFETFSALQAEIDNMIRSERTKRGIEAKLTSGIYPYKPPLGYLCLHAKKHGQKKMQPDPVDPVLFPIIQKALRHFAAGECSKKKLIAVLDEFGFGKARGKRTTSQTVSRLLYQYIDFYRGVLVNPWKPEVIIKGRHQAMITEEEYLCITAIRDGKRLPKTIKRSKHHELFPLRGLVRCADCQRMYTASVARGNGGGYPYYHCRSAGCLNYGKSVAKEIIESQFAQELDRFALSAEFFDSLKAAIQTELKSMNLNMESKTVALDRIMAELEQRRQRIYEMCEDGSYNKDEFLERKSIIEKEMQEVALEKQTLYPQHGDLNHIFQESIAFLQNCGVQWQDIPHELQNEFQLIVFKDGISYRRNEGFVEPKPALVFKLSADYRAGNGINVPREGKIWNQLVAELAEIYQFVQRFNFK